MTENTKTKKTKKETQDTKATKDTNESVVILEDGSKIDLSKETLPEAFDIDAVEFMDMIADEVDAFNALMDKPKKTLVDFRDMITVFGTCSQKAKYTILLQMSNEYDMWKAAGNAISLLYWQTVGQPLNDAMSSRMMGMEAEIDGLRNTIVGMQRALNEAIDIYDDEDEDDIPSMDPNSVEAMIKEKERREKNGS